jgi:hypothetical protein
MDLKEIEKNLRILMDIEEIKKLQAYYVARINPPKWNEIKDCFAKDAVFDTYAGRVRGIELVEKILTENISQLHKGQFSAFIVQPYIEVDGDKAKASWGLVELLPNDLKMPFMTPDAPNWVYGPYEMEYVRENGKWKISYLKWRSDIIK